MYSKVIVRYFKAKGTKKDARVPYHHIQSAEILEQTSCKTRVF